MNIGYIRLAKAAPSKEEQEEALHAAGLPKTGKIFVEQVATRRRTEYVDPTPQRTEMINGLAAGDTVYVASASRLGTGVVDIEETMRVINEKGAVVIDAATKEAVRWHPDASAAIAFVFRGYNGLRNELAAHMRAKRPEDKKGGAPSVPQERLEEARKLFFNLDLHIKDVIRRTGLSQRTLYRHFGKRTGKNPAK